VSIDRFSIDAVHSLFHAFLEVQLGMASSATLMSHPIAMPADSARAFVNPHGAAGNIGSGSAARRSLVTGTPRVWLYAFDSDPQELIA
jgi:hypothetical protein